MKAAQGLPTPRRWRDGLHATTFAVLRHMIEDEFSHLKHADAVLAVENLA
jgi:hypothetical protein